MATVIIYPNLENAPSCLNHPITKCVAVAASVATVLLLISLHALSPEFDPSWRMVSEYANGQYAWVLSLMFGAWALGTAAVCLELKPRLHTHVAKIGLGFLLISALGEAMAAMFDINHPLHDVAGLLGVPTMPVAACLISANLRRTWPPGVAKNFVLWASHLIWVSLLAFVLTSIVLVVTLHHAGAHMSSHLTHLPPGVIALSGWTNRLFVTACCLWLVLVGRGVPDPETRKAFG